MLDMRKLAVGVAVFCAFGAAFGSPVCRIGSKEYETLQEAFTATEGLTSNKTITLLDDVYVTSKITVPRTSKTVTLDGAGHVIYQAAPTVMFANTTYFTYVTFTNVVVCGGGEAQSTVDVTGDKVGVFWNATSGSNTFTFDAGCVISNFYGRGPLMSNGDGSKFVVKPGALITHNTMSTKAAYSGGVFYLSSSSANTLCLQIDGGEISHNQGWYGSVASCYRDSRSR